MAPVSEKSKHTPATPGVIVSECTDGVLALLTVGQYLTLSWVLSYPFSHLIWGGGVCGEYGVIPFFQIERITVQRS